MDSEELPAPPRVPLGVPGLDPILEGGLLRGGVYFVQGSPGSGKTILGNQVCFAHAAAGGQAVYVTLLAESHQRMLAHLRRMSFFRPDMVGEQVAYLSAFRVLEADGLAALLTLLRKEMTARSATLLVLDGLLTAEEAATSPVEYRKFIHELQIVASMMGCTVLLLASTRTTRPFQPEHTMVDGIIEMGDELRRLRAARYLIVHKLRGAAPVRGRHTVEITDDGIVVRPRLETVATGATHATDGDGAPRRPAARRGFGVAELDRMLGGGVPAGSMTMVLGPSGVGKTTLGLQFLVEGARRGEPGMHFGFFEQPRALLEKSARIRLGLEEVHAEGLVSLHWRPPVEGIIDILGHDLLDAVRRAGATRLFLDGIQGFEASVDNPARLREVFAALADAMAAMGVTALYTMETLDLFGPRIEVPLRGLSPITQNVLLLRHVEVNARLVRMLSVLKVRDSEHDTRLREFRITSRGITLADTFEDTSDAMTGTARPAGTKSSARKGGTPSPSGKPPHRSPRPRPRRR